MVNPDHTVNCQVSSLTIPEDGMTVHMQKYGFVRVFQTVNKDGIDRFWASNFLTMDLRTEKTCKLSAGPLKIITEPGSMQIRKREIWYFYRRILRS